MCVPDQHEIVVSGGSDAPGISWSLSPNGSCASLETSACLATSCGNALRSGYTCADLARSSIDCTTCRLAGHCGLVSGISAGATNWTTANRLLASNMQFGDNFGHTGVATSDDGSLVVAGARLEDTGGANAGALYVYEAL
eukprot:COSAG01_NODE_31624_length_594_cov_1.038384_1_plen_139_part_10